MFAKVKNDILNRIDLNNLGSSSLCAHLAGLIICSKFKCGRSVYQHNLFQSYALLTLFILNKIWFS